MDPNSIYKKIEAHVRDLFETHHKPTLVYHNLKHTVNVVGKVQEIAGHYHLSETDTLVLYAAAWFHDTGYLFADAATHEAKSVELMREFFKTHLPDPEVMKRVEECILATKPPHNAHNLLQEILCDADTYHLGTKDFKLTNKLVRKERELQEAPVDRSIWIQKTLAFMQSHKYYTSYCQHLLESRKQKNIRQLEEKLLKQEEPAPDTPVAGPEMKQKSSLMTKGIQTMLRLTSDNHLELSGLADGKANILISVNAIIISVILTVLLRRLEVDTYLTIPTVIFLAFSVTTIVIAILATRPKVSQGVFSEEDLKAKRTNLLFFGNFHKASMEQYEQAMRTMMSDPDYLYGSLVKDIYQLGVVLGVKYRLIRLAYNVFMVGIVVSVLAFSIAVVINNASGGNAINSSSSPF